MIWKTSPCAGAPVEAIRGNNYGAISYGESGFSCSFYPFNAILKRFLGLASPSGFLGVARVN